MIIASDPTPIPGETPPAEPSYPEIPSNPSPSEAPTNPAVPDNGRPYDA